MNTFRMDVFVLLARRYAGVAAIAFAMFLVIATPGSGQTSNNGQVTNNGQLTRRTIFYEKRLKMLNAAQHQSMVADTDRLLKLVTDLNSQISSSNANALTPEQLRMVAEIEKLAHSVKDKMRMSVRSSAEYNGPTSITPFGAR
jgi:adenylate kinase